MGEYVWRNVTNGGNTVCGAVCCSSMVHVFDCGSYCACYSHCPSSNDFWIFPWKTCDIL